MLVIVSTHIDGEHVSVGDLVYTPGARETGRSRFTYDPSWLGRGYQIDPGLPLDAAAHEVRGLPLAFLDASPDSWGKTIAGRAVGRALDDGELLLAANDLTRQGALRFRSDELGDFETPPEQAADLTELPDLLQAAESIQSDGGTHRDLMRMVGAGSTGMGGAGPKAAIRDGGHLWIAKFPRLGDIDDGPAWEWVSLNIAERAGCVVPERRLVSVGRRHVLLVRRFDRTDAGVRIPYMSARTMTQTRDLGAAGDYAGRRGIGNRLRHASADPHADLLTLWRIAAVNLAINNTDNHLRNHGFLRTRLGWSPSPIFDLEPNHDTTPFTGVLFDGAATRSTGLAGLGRMATEYGLGSRVASQCLEEVVEATRRWREDAAEAGISERVVARYESL